MKRKIAVLVMVDGAMIGEQYLEYEDYEQEWSADETIDPALHFFY